ncbi:MAG: type IX secretion system membrane protein PorP/SprF [Bacteroidota bacterium]
MRKLLLHFLIPNDTTCRLDKLTLFLSYFNITRMSMIRQLLASVILMTFFCQAWAQDVTFSQFYAAPLHINPAFAGVTAGPRITLNYRNQWPSWPNAFQTYAATYEHPAEELNSGFGVIVLQDNAGDGIYQTLNLSGVYSYQAKVREDFYIKFGLQAGIIQTQVDWQRLVFEDQLDPIFGRVGVDGESIPTEEIPPGSLTQTDIDFSTGILIYGGNFYGGVALKHINRPDERFFDVNSNLISGLPTRISVHAGAEFSVYSGNTTGGTTFFSPNLLFEKQASFTQLNLGMYVGHGAIYGGAWYRHTFENPDAVIGLIGYRYGILKIGYSYDVTISELAASAPGGTHEVSVVINVGDSKRLQRKNIDSRYSNCFKMIK